MILPESCKGKQWIWDVAIDFCGHQSGRLKLRITRQKERRKSAPFTNMTRIQYEVTPGQ